MPFASLLAAGGNLLNKGGGETDSAFSGTVKPQATAGPVSSGGGSIVVNPPGTFNWTSFAIGAALVYVFGRLTR